MSNIVDQETEEEKKNKVRPSRVCGFFGPGLGVRLSRCKTHLIWLGSIYGPQVPAFIRVRGLGEYATSP